jgi:hypothetical protein
VVPGKAAKLKEARKSEHEQGPSGGEMKVGGHVRFECQYRVCRRRCANVQAAKPKLVIASTQSQFPVLRTLNDQVWNKILKK